MANAKLWWYPDPASTDVEEVDLLGGLQDLQITPVVVYEGARAITGAPSSLTFTRWSSARFTLGPFTSKALARDLSTVQNHLRRGGLIAIANDADKAVAGFLHSPPGRGTQTIGLPYRPWPFNASAALVATDEVVLQGPSPGYRREEHEVSVVGAGDAYTFTDPIRYTYFVEDEWTLMREINFWPLLRMPVENRNDSILTHDHRHTWTFSAVLEEAIDVFQAFYEFGGSVSTDGSDAGSTVTTPRRNTPVTGKSLLGGT